MWENVSNFYEGFQKMKDIASNDIAKRKSKSKSVQAIQKDGWMNIVTGLGTSKDKNTYSELEWVKTDRKTAENYFSADEMGKKVASIIPHDATREGISWNMGKGPNQVEVSKFLASEFRRLRVWSKFAWAWTLARVHGGTIVYMSIKDGRSLDQPVNWAKVKKISSLTVIDRWDLENSVGRVINNISDPKFGTPQLYTYEPSSMPGEATEQVHIHNSRTIRFDGLKLPTRLYVRNDYWHDSIYGSLGNALRRYAGNLDNISTIISDFNQPVYKIDGLSDAISQDEDELIVKKLTQVDLMRSVARAIVLDKEDEFQNVSTTVTGAKDLIDLTIQRLVAGVDVPHTRLLGQSPSGLGATGQSELVNYYDNVGAMQGEHLTIPLDTITDAIFAQSNAIDRPDDLEYEFNPLFQQTREEEAKSRMMQSQTDEKYFSMGVLKVDEISESRFGGGRYSYDTVITDEKRIAGEGAKVMGSSNGSEDPTTKGKVEAAGKTGQKSGTDDLAGL